MKKLLVSFMMVFALVSCSTEELGNSGNTPASSKGGVQLVLSTEGFDEVGSRAVDESVIHDVNILQYVNGALRPVIYLDESNADFSKAVEVSGLEKADATFMDDATDADGNKVKVMQENGKEHFIFIIANYGSTIDRQQVHDLASLKKFTMSFSGKTTMENLPMTGFYYGGINPTSTTQMKVTLQRAVAKINFTLDTSNFRINGKTPSALFVNSIKLCNVPGNITLYPCKVRPSLPKDDITAGKWNFGTQTPFPTKEEMEATGGSVTCGDDENQSSTANTANTYTYVAYIPENARGSYDGITDNKDKRPSKCDNSISEEDEKTDKSYTYILVDLNYVINGTAKNVTYRFYLGGNSTGDMNMLRNTQYNVTTRLRGANEADTRISISNIPSIMVLDPANCYMIDMSDVVNGNQFVIPLSQVNKGWKKITEYDATQEDTKAKVADIIKSGKWKIKTLWKTWDGSSNITGTIGASSTSDNPVAKLNIPASVKNGNNAVVELVSTEDNNVYWSWHLWFTDYKPDKSTDAERKGQVHQYASPIFQTGVYKDKYMMDRNLGATNTGESGAIAYPTVASEAVKYNGLHYQFGRKDPFVGTSNGSYTFIDIYDADGTLLSNGANIPFKKDAGSASSSFLAKAAMNPFTFYTGSNIWTVEKNGLWDENGTDKSVFDPCPPGWRVPVYGTWESFPSSWYSSGATAGRMYISGNVQAWYPALGCLGRTTGTIDSRVGSYGFYWSAMPSSDPVYSYFLYFSSGMIRQNGTGCKADALSVRCIQE